MAAVGLWSINLCRASHGFSSIVLEEQLEANEMLAKEIDVIQNRTIVKCVARFAADSAGLIGVKVLVGCWCIDMAVLQSFEVIEAHHMVRDITWIVIIE